MELLEQDPDDEVNSCAWNIADVLINKKTHPAIELKDSKKYGRIILTNLKKIPPDVPYEPKRLKTKIKLLIKLYSDLEGLLERLKHGMRQLIVQGKCLILTTEQKYKKVSIDTS